MTEPINYDRKLFADNLRRLMLANGEKQIDIAKLLGVSKSTVSAYCSGEQMPRINKLEALARHFGVPRSALIGSGESDLILQRTADLGPAGPVVDLFRSLNTDGRNELLRYGHYLARQPEYQQRGEHAPVELIKHDLVPAAAGYASPIEGEDYELIPRSEDAPVGADFAISIQGDSMEPYIPDGSMVYVRRDAPLKEFEAGIFYVDGDVFCKQWCVDYAGTLHLLSANPRRQDANIVSPRDSGRTCVCFGKVLLDKRLPEPVYE